jgi:hypothetical protein
VPENKILFCDTDVFWLKNPYPLKFEESNKLCCSGNTGVFYFDKRKEEAKKAFDMWKSYMALALLDLDFREHVRSSYPDCATIVQDEVIFGYLSRSHQGLHETAPGHENCPIDIFRYFPKAGKKAKNVHALKESIGPGRGRLCLCINELRSALEKTVGTQGIKELFAGETKAPLRLSIYDLASISRAELLRMLVYTEHKFANVADLTRPGKNGWFQWELNMSKPGSVRYG